jgi:hypothetical protein
MTDHTLPLPRSRPATLPAVIPPTGGAVARRSGTMPARIINAKPLPRLAVRRRSRKPVAVAITAPSVLATVATSGWALAHVEAVVNVFMWLGISAAAVVTVVLLVLAALSRRKCQGLHCSGCRG